ncbi:MAG: type II toxin-antitoxin system RelE/ParE family toxin [Bacteroidota bacterium]
MARVIWSPQALADLTSIGDYLAQESPAFAQSFVDGAFDAVARLEVFPRSGRVVPGLDEPDLRELLYRGYRIFHLVSGSEDNERVEILSVFHQTRQFGGDEGLEPR